jgi:2'-5' RNA ligase
VRRRGNEGRASGSAQRGAAERSSRAGGSAQRGAAERSSGASIRAFFAIELSEPARRAAAELAAALCARPGGDAVRWVRPESLHVTLRFLGDVEPGRAEALAAQVREQVAALAPFELRLAGLGSLPPNRRPRVLVLELEPQEPLAALALAVERGVVAAGCAPERRAYRGHLTLGRVRERGAPPSLEGLPVPPADFAVGEAVLFASQPQPGGSVYTPLARAALRGGPNEFPSPLKPGTPEE